MNRRFAIAVIAISGLGAAAIPTLIAAAKADSPVLFGAGAVLVLVGTLGLLALVRAVAISERQRGRA